MADAPEYSQETLELFALIDSYADGELNLEQTVTRIKNLCGIEPADMKGILYKIDRQNVLIFKDFKGE